MSALQSTFSGTLDKAIVCDRIVEKTLTFLWDSLLPWHNDPLREQAEAEEKLNGDLSDFLNDRARVEKFDMVKFRHEEQQGTRRRVDMAAKPVGSMIIRGKLFNRYEPFLVIEGKRLPPPSKSREREYVTGENGAMSGGIQRFKFGKHGGNHDVAVIVGYVQEKSPHDWHPIVNGWILALTEKQPDDWKKDETLSDFQSCPSQKRIKSISIHHRKGECKSNSIQLHHFWIQMN